MASAQHEKERLLRRDVARLVEPALPGVEVLAVEITGRDRFCVFIDHPTGVDHALCERTTNVLRSYLDEYSVEVSSPGLDRPLRTQPHFERAVGRKVRVKTEALGLRGEVVEASPRAVQIAERLGRSGHTVRRDRAGQSDRRRDEAMSQEIVEAVREIEREKGIESGTLVAALEDALLAAYKKTPGASRHATVELDERGDFRVFAIDLPTDIESRLLEEARERTLEELERIEEETGEKNHTLLSDDDLEIDWSDVPENLVAREDVTPDNFGRIAAQTAKQVILQRIREAEREMMYDEYVDRVGEVVTGIVQQTGDRRNILVDLGKVEALLPGPEQVDGERYEQGSRIKAVIREVRTGTKGPQVILSRRDPELIKTLFELEVPEIADGLVEIRGVAREPGYRSKIAVESHAQGVDPVGACVGPRGSRVRMVVSELRGEKIDIIPWNPEPARFVAKALSPARVREVYLDDDGKEATVVVPDDQLALAIGKEGMNARLAAPPHRLEDRHHLRHRVRPAGGRGGLRRRRRRGRGLLGPLRGGPVERQALPEHVSARLALLRRPGAPGARAARAERGGQPDRRRGGARARAARRHRAARGRHRGRGRVRRPGAGGVPGRPGRRSCRGRGRDARDRRGAGRAPLRRRRPERRHPRRDGRARGERLSAAPDPHVRRLRPQGAPGGAPPFPCTRRPPRPRRRPGPGRVHVPAPPLLRAGDGPPGLQPGAPSLRPRRPLAPAPLHLTTDGKRQAE